MQLMSALRCRRTAYVGYLMTASAVSLVTGALYIALQIQPQQPQVPKHSAALLCQPVLLALCAAVPATQTLIMSKCVSMMIVETLSRETQLRSWFFWLAVAVPPCTSFLWAMTLSHALSRFPSIVAVPVLQVVRSSAMQVGLADRKLWTLSFLNICDSSCKDTEDLTRLQCQFS